MLTLMDFTLTLSSSLQMFSFQRFKRHLLHVSVCTSHLCMLHIELRLAPICQHSVKLCTCIILNSEGQTHKWSNKKQKQHLKPRADFKFGLRDFALICSAYKNYLFLFMSLSEGKSFPTSNHMSSILDIYLLVWEAFGFLLNIVFSSD